MASLSPLWAALLALAAPIPVGTDRRLRRRPWVTLILIAANVAVYLFTRPDLSPDAGAALFRHAGVLPAHPTLRTAFESLFLHVSLLHLFWNMVFLWLFGAHVEEALGPAVYTVIYFVGGLMATLLHVAICRLLGATHPDILQTPLVGASGAVSALLAPYAVRFYRSRVRLVWLPGLALPKRTLAQFDAPGTVVIAVWLVENVIGAIRGALQPESGGVAYWAHVGGFVAGLVAAELTGLLRKGWSDYLLEDARTTASRGRGGAGRAAARYRAYLAADPDNWQVRLEMAAMMAHEGDPALAKEGNHEALDAVRAQLAGVSGLACYEKALELGLRLDLSPADRLQLARLAQDSGDSARAATLLRSFVALGLKGPEDESARLRLAQALRTSNPAEADSVLEDFILKYPRSTWRGVAEQRRAEIASTLARSPRSAQSEA